MVRRMLGNWFGRRAGSGGSGELTGGRQRPPVRKRGPQKPFSSIPIAHRRRNCLRLEILEDRLVPALITVDQDLDQRPQADFQVIQEAINAANPGDVIHVFDGTYDEVLEISTNRSGVQLDGLKLINKAGADTVIAPATGSIAFDDAIVDIRSAQRVLFKGFTIDGGAVDGVGLVSQLDSAIRVSGEGSAIVRDNTIFGIFDTDGAAADTSGFGIHIGDPGDGNGTATVFGNEVSDYFKSGVLVEGGDGGTSRADVMHNTVTGGGRNKIVVQIGVDVFGAGDC